MHYVRDGEKDENSAKGRRKEGLVETEGVKSFRCNKMRSTVYFICEQGWNAKAGALELDHPSAGDGMLGCLARQTSLWNSS